MTEKNRLLISNVIFEIAIALLPFENFFFAPSSGWATITPIILALYIVFNLKIFFQEIVKFKKTMLLLAIGVVFTLINYIFVTPVISNIINAIISLGLGLVCLFSFDIYYIKNKKDIKKIVNILFISYLISLIFGIIEFITIKANITIIKDAFNVLFKRDYIQYGRVQYFFTEPSFIGMHIFGILLPIYWISKERKMLYLIIAFIISTIAFNCGVRILLDIAVVGTILLFAYLARNKKYKYIIGIPIIMVILVTFLYNYNYRIKEICDKGIYADGSLATRYFRIQASVIGYTRKPIHALFGYGIGNSIVPLREGYEEALKTYKSSYIDEVKGLGDLSYTDDSVSYCFYIRFISEYGIILIIAFVYEIIRLTQESVFKYKYSYLLIIAYLYLQFESYAFYALWLFVLIMIYTKKRKDENKVIVGYIEDGTTSGIDKYLLNFYKVVNSKNRKIDFLTKLYSKEMDNFLKKNNSRLFKVSHNRKPIKQFFETKKIIEEGNYGIAYFNISETFNFIGILAAKSAGVDKVIIHSHSSGSDKTSRKKRKMAEILNFICKPIILFCADERIACSKNAAEWLYTKRIAEKKRYITIYNAIDYEKFKFDTDIRNKIRKKYNLENKFVIGHVGRFTYQKNHEILLDIFKEILKKKENSVLICIGNGEKFDEIKVYAKHMGISENIIFTGNVNNVNEYMQAFDIFVLPSRFEGLPIVGIEAQLAGLPCIFSDKITEEVIISQNAIRLPIDSTNQWIAEILNRNERRNELLPVAEHYKIENQEKQFEEILKNESSNI